MQIVVALLEPLQEGGELTLASSRALEELIIKGRGLLQAKIKGLPPLPQSIQVSLRAAPANSVHDKIAICLASIPAFKLPLSCHKLRKTSSCI